LLLQRILSFFHLFTVKDGSIEQFFL